jgi:hypothetical protein
LHDVSVAQRLPRLPKRAWASNAARRVAARSQGSATPPVA